MKNFINEIEVLDVFGKHNFKFPFKHNVTFVTGASEYGYDHVFKTIYNRAVMMPGCCPSLNPKLIEHSCHDIYKFMLDEMGVDDVLKFSKREDAEEFIHVLHEAFWYFRDFSIKEITDGSYEIEIFDKEKERKFVIYPFEKTDVDNRYYYYYASEGEATLIKLLRIVMFTDRKLVMLYNPENNLHIVHHRFLGNMIHKLSDKRQFVIFTNSPQLIGSHREGNISL